MSGPSTGFSSNAPSKKARIEIIPLIDVIFFLLATFVLFTLSLNKSNGLPVTLPATETSEARDPSGTVTISFTSEGTIGWDKDLITLDEFVARLQAYKQTEPDGRILINGDEMAFFSQARYVIDEVRKAGIAKVLLETRTRPSS